MTWQHPPQPRSVNDCYREHTEPCYWSFLDSLLVSHHITPIIRCRTDHGSLKLLRCSIRVSNRPFPVVSFTLTNPTTYSAIFAPTCDSEFTMRSTNENCSLWLISGRPLSQKKKVQESCHYGAQNVILNALLVPDCVLLYDRQ